MSLMEFDQVLDPWKLTPKNNPHDVRIIRRGNFRLLFHVPVWQMIKQLIQFSDNQSRVLAEFVGLILQVAVQPQC